MNLCCYVEIPPLPTAVLNYSVGPLWETREYSNDELVAQINYKDEDLYSICECDT